MAIDYPNNQEFELSDLKDTNLGIFNPVSFPKVSADVKEVLIKIKQIINIFTILYQNH